MEMALAGPNVEDIPTSFPTRVQRQTRHLPHLDGLRACLALYVMVHHIYLTIWPDEIAANAPMSFHRVTAALMTQSRAAIDWFIVLSGFCLMLPTLSRGYKLRNGAVDFYRKRARRILPTYWTAVAVSVVLCLTVVAKKTGTHWDYSLPVTWPAILSALFLVNDIFEPLRINHVFWSIAVEWRIYFLFPAILWLWRKSGGRTATLIVAGSATLVAFALPHISMKLLFMETTLSFIGLFALGACGAYVGYGLHGQYGARFKWLLTIVAIIASFLAVMSHGDFLPSRLSREPIFDALYGLAMATWLASWSMPGRSLARSALSWLPLPSIGIFAFSLYLIHAPLIQLCWQMFVRPAGLNAFASFLLLLFTAMPIALAGAYLFFLAFERPFLSSRQQQAALEEGAIPT